ncbi:hypothetical protein HNY73_012525 [Argiope bruennichi]|uniref:Uncharacterized protein n=1 Tax=Argiope bruennichi TaxID=94029 RepID=A0A8T0EV73_ARGBR|nr:hypothetical protein HNY73_012525 [Argiope bruennichi]
MQTTSIKTNKLLNIYRAIERTPLQLSFIFQRRGSEKGKLIHLSESSSRLPSIIFCGKLRPTWKHKGETTSEVLLQFQRPVCCGAWCNGKTSALMSNITSTEAVCIISNCLQQVRQGQPQFTGRRRRDTFDASEVPELTYDVSEDSAVHKDFDDAESLSERVDLADALPSMKEFLNRYTFIDDKSAKELEEQVVDRIEVTVAEDEEIDDF